MIRPYPELENCTVCPQACGIDRYEGPGSCDADHRLQINLAHLHHGEEPVLSGTRGSGTVFFSHCNLHCRFCQNYQISQLGWGDYITEEKCAELLIDLQSHGAHNVNLVSPTHYTPQLINVLKMARNRGLKIPVVWNSNGYENLSTLQKLSGLVDIYLPDFKYAHAAYGLKYSSARDYPSIALAALREMHSQVGNLQLDSEGIAVSGLLVRHLVLPHRLSGTKEILYLLREDFGPDVALSLMAQYYPAGRAREYPELSRGLEQREYEEVLETAGSLGFTQIFTQELSSQPDWTPDFREAGDPVDRDNLHFRGKENHA